MELWKAIPSYEGIYEASNKGRIRSAEGKTTLSSRYGIVHWKQRVLKQKCNKNSKGRIDARVTLWKEKKPHDYLVSRLIALTWCDGYFEGATVNHIDGKPLNNNAENLEWVSHAENIRKGFKDGLYHCEIAVELIGPDGNREQFRSMASASRFLGKSPGYISDMLAKGKTHVACGYSVVITE